MSFRPDHNAEEVRMALDALDKHAEGGENLAALRVGECANCFHCEELKQVVNAVNIACAAGANPAVTYRAVAYVIASEIIAYFADVTEDEARQVVLFERNLAQKTGEVENTLKKLRSFFSQKKAAAKEDSNAAEDHTTEDAEQTDSDA